MKHTCQLPHREVRFQFFSKLILEISPEDGGTIFLRNVTTYKSTGRHNPENHNGESTFFITLLNFKFVRQFKIIQSFVGESIKKG
jgi:hypothetical protein